MMRWLLILALLLPLTSQAEVYRWVDESGNVTYSDQPHQGSEKVKLPPITTYEPQPAEGTQSAPGAQPAAGAIAVSLQITSPKPDQNIWSTAGIVDLAFEVTPQLGKAQHIAILLDGKGDPVSSPSTDFRISNVDRGTHTVTAWVADAAGQRISQTMSVTFHLHRATKPEQGTTPPGTENPYAPPTSEQQQKTLVPPTQEEQQKTLVPPTQEEQQQTLVPPSSADQQKQYVPPSRQDQQKSYTPPPSFTPQ